jgi:UDP-N-acetylmuramate dehydrogenase
MIVKHLNDEMIKEIFRENFIGEVLFDEPMRRHTTLRIGGRVDAFVIPRNVNSLKDIIVTLTNENVPLMPVGGGSNLLVSDGGIGGAVISTISLDRLEIAEDNDEEVIIFAEAGTPLQRLINFAKDKGYKGVEGLTGIPGFVGGAVKGNAGSFGFEIGDVIESVTAVGSDGRIISVERENLKFGYRSSNISDGTIILGATIRLKKDDMKAVAKRITDFFMEKRRKQPISEWSAGCVFKNPGGEHAGRLIDEALCKGMRRGDIEVSSLHSNFFVNKGNGKATDFLGLMEDVKSRVVKSFGIELEPEIRIVGRYGEK